MRVGIESKEIVDRILSDREVHDSLCDDLAPPIELFSMDHFLKNKLAYFLMPNEGTLFILIPRSNIVYEVHTCILPECRGKLAKSAAHSAMDWMFKNSNCLKMISYIPITNRPAIVFSKWCGWKQEGVCRKSFLKNGVLHDRLIVGMTGEEFYGNR